MAPARWLAVVAAAASLGAAAQEICAPAGRPACLGPSTPREFVKQKLPSSVYDKTQRPTCSNRNAKEVEVQFKLTQVNSIDQKLGIVSVVGYMHTWWTDPRLAYNASCVKSIVLTGADTKAAWAPDLYIDNLVKRTTSGFPMSISIDPNGNVEKSEQVKLDLKSTLDLGKLPYDKHVATITLASYSQDISSIRLKARGGVIGAGISGIGIKAEPMTNNVWELPEGSATQGFETPGNVTVEWGSWDYLHLSFPFARQPKFLIDQVIVPAILFLLVSYIQFWVDAAQAPARAALAVIPVLIMRTLSNSVYRSLPEGSQRMWLTDNLSVLTFLCIIAAVEFGAVEFSCVRERSRGRKHDGLKSSGDKARFMMKQAVALNFTLDQLLQRYKKVPFAADPDQVAVDVQDEGNPSSSPNANPTSTSFTASPDAVAEGIKESDLLFVQYTKDIFDMYDTNHSHAVNANETRCALTYFNIYVSQAQISSVMCMFLRDQGVATPADETKAELRFSQFCGLLLDIDKYKLKHKTGTIVGKFRPAAIKGKFQSIAPSKRLDVVARWLFPIVMIAQQILFHLEFFLNWY